MYTLLLMEQPPSGVIAPDANATALGRCSVLTLLLAACLLGLSLPTIAGEALAGEAISAEVVSAEAFTRDVITGEPIHRASAAHKAGLPAQTPTPAGHHVAQRTLLEAYVGCVRGSSNGRGERAVAATRAACASARAAYQATLPAELAEQITETIDAGPDGRGER